jgi:hypothetical protein
LSMIPLDFNVVLLKGDQESGLFFSRRETVWHFLRWDNNDGANSITQWHVPRCVAAAAASVRVPPRSVIHSHRAGWST